ncbi:hypothetical protein MRX96_011850 [Rhipicephalus microplus]
MLRVIALSRQDWKSLDLPKPASGDARNAEPKSCRALLPFSREWVPLSSRGPLHGSDNVFRVSRERTRFFPVRPETPVRRGLEEARRS